MHDARTRGLLGLSLLVASLATGCGSSTSQTTTQLNTKPGLGTPGRVACDLYAAPGGSDSAPGSRSRPFRTAQRLVHALHSGQTGCFRGGAYTFSLLNLKTPEVTLAPARSEAVTLRGEIDVLPGATGLTIEGLTLDGQGTHDIGPKIFADGVTLRDNDITNDHTGLCVLITRYYSGAPPRGVVIDRNRIHDCGTLPATNHQHGIYVAHASHTTIRNNWIYDNADRGVQLYPNADYTTVAGNVIDRNGQGVLIADVSDHNLIERNVISNSMIRYNVESSQATGTGNLVRGNCVWMSRSSYGGVPDGSGIGPQSGFSAADNKVADPLYSDRTVNDYTLSSKSRCNPLGTEKPAGSRLGN